MKRNKLIIFLLLLIAVPAYTQWERLPGPYGSGYISQNAFFREGDTIFILLTGSIYKSSDKGYHWNFMPVNIPDGFVLQKILYKKDSLIFISADGYRVDYSVFFSSDYGKTYKSLLDSGYNYSVAELNNNIYISREPYYSHDQRSLILSKDDGKTWEDISPKKNTFFISLESFDGALYAFYSRSQFHNDWFLGRSRDGGITWDSLFGFHGVTIDSFPYPQMFTPFYDHNNDINLWIAVESPAGNHNRIQNLYKILLKGDSAHISDFPADHILDGPIANMLFNNSILSASTQNNIYVYYPYSDSWQNITDKLQKTRIYSYFPASNNSGEYLLGQNPLSRFTPHSNYSVLSDTGITATNISQIFNYQNNLYTVTNAPGGPLFSSTDHGESWIQGSMPPNNSANIYNLNSTPKGLLYTSGDTIYLKTDDTVFQTRLARSPGRFFKMESKIFCNAFDSVSRMCRSDDSGVSWVKLSPIPARNSWESTVLNNIVFLTDENEDAYVSYDGCITWKQISRFPPKYTRCLASKNSAIYTVSEFPYPGVFNQMYESLDTGKSWVRIGPGLQDPIFFIFPYKNFLLLFGDLGIYRCNPDGSDFIQVIGDPIRYCTSVETDSEYLYVGTGFLGIFRVRLDEVLTYGNGVSTPVHFENLSSKLYPNPSDGFISISAPEPIIKISIFDEKGVEVNLPEEKFRIEDKNVKIDIHSLRPGAYICRLKTASVISNQKFIVF
jgi:hypothetical protein